MIQLFSGTPGSGKSLHMAKMIYDYSSYRKDRLIIVNFEIDTDKLRFPDRVVYVSNNDLTPEFLKKTAEEFYYTHPLKEGSILLFIDECQILFNARNWNEKGRLEWLSFFSQHRKYGFDIFLVAQFDMMIDKQIRSLIEYEQIHRKVSNYGFLGTLVKLFAFGDLFICVEHWYTIKKKTSQSFFKARKKYYSLYDTFKHFEN